MQRRSPSLVFILVTTLVVPMLLLSASDLWAESRGDRVRELEEINRRWQGAECRLKTQWTFRRKPNDGWYKSNVQIASSDRFKRITLRLRLRDRESLAKRFVGDALAAGTPFECLGFRFREKDLDNLYLALRSREGVETELVVWTGNRWASKPDLKELPDVERFLRLHWIDVRSQAERLEAVAPTSDAVSRARNPFAPRGAAPVPQAPSASTTSGASTRETVAAVSDDGVFRPTVEILAVSVQPSGVRAGDKVQLIIHYSVTGLPAGAQFEVDERRALHAGERELTASTQKIARSNGTYTSRLEAPIPPGASAGLYRFVTRVGMPGVEAQEGSALFEVLPP